MKVLILSLDSSILNPDSESYSRMKEYAGLAEELHVFVFSRSGYTRIKTRIDAESLHVYQFGAHLVGWIQALFFGKKLVKENGIDVVSAQEPFELGLLGLLISKFSQFHRPNYGTAKKVGLNVQLHGDFYGNPYWRQERLLNRLRWRLGLFVLRRAQSIRVVSERIKQSLISDFTPHQTLRDGTGQGFQTCPVVSAKRSTTGVSDLKIIKVSIYTDIEYFRNAKPTFDLKEKYPQFNFIILTVANLAPVKNLDFLIRAMKKLHDILPNAGLVIVGSGPLEKKLKSISYKPKAISYVVFEGPQTDLVSYYKGADCFVLVSKYEGWGRAVVEAAASGLPIVMTDVGLAGELIKHEESGIVLSGFNEDDLVRALSQIYFNESLRKQLALGAQEKLKTLPSKLQTLELIKKSWELALK